MAKRPKTIITCAITGAIHTPTMSDALPYTAQDIAAQAIAAAEAGAAILHLHARRPADGGVSINPQDFAAFLPQVKQATGAVVNISTGGSLKNTIEERIAPALAFSPEMCSLNMGSMNLGLFPMLTRFKTFQHDWERGHLEATRDMVFKNTFADSEMILTTCSESGTRFEFECYDTAHLYNLAHFVDRGLVKPPFFVQTVFGLLGGIGSHGDDVSHMRRTADRLFGSDYEWSVLGAGKSQMRVAAISASMGGHVRVGLEDSLWVGPGRLASSNAQQVTQVRSIIEALGLAVASPDDARELLSLKGRAAVAI